MLKLSLRGLFDSASNQSTSSAEFVINGVTYSTTLADILEEEGYQFPIGSGAYGTVYRKKHRPSGLVMAEKIVSKGGVNLEKYADTEKQLWRVCNHEHLVNHYGAIETAMSVHLYFELMSSCFEKLLQSYKTSLDNQGIQYSFPEEVIAKVAYSTFSALWYLKEAHGVIHRDIKPSNILIGKDGSVKVTDFGLARKLVDSRAFTTGIGCLAYLSPERISTNSGGYGTPADVWSIGITAIEFATGSHPILKTPNMIELEILTTIVDDEPPRLTGSQFSETFRDFVGLCLQKNPAERYKLGESHDFLRMVPTDTSMLQWCQMHGLLS